MQGFPRHDSQLVQILGGEDESGVFRELLVSVMSGENREQEVRGKA